MVTVLVQQDQDQQNGGMEVTVEPRTASPSWSLAAKGSDDDAVLGSTMTSIPLFCWSWSCCIETVTFV